MLNVEDMQKLCDYIYVGMTIKESFSLLGVKKKDHVTLLSVTGIRHLVSYARFKAKYDLMLKCHQLAMSDQPTLHSTKMLCHLIASRFGVVETSKELAMKQEQHAELMAHRRETLRQWADYQSAKMVAEASGSQLVEFQQLEQR